MPEYNARSGDTSPSVDTFNNLAEETNENGHAAEAENGHPDVTPSEPSLEIEESLDPEHQRMLLEESGISREVVIARGYRTVETMSELRRLGFSDAQCNAPGLLVPIYSPSGEISNYQYRPDQPRIMDGKPVKYETPKGSRMTLDVPPFAREKLGDPSIPLWITEGVKKGDALASRGLCATSLLGVWNWRGTNEFGGKTALPAWESIALNGRRVYIVFDSDVMLKPQVYTALVRLKSFLEGRGAKVAVIYLPAGEDGSKQGVDDFLAAGNSVDDLLALATTELRGPPEEEEDEVPPIPYRETSRGVVWDKPTRDGTIPMPLTNFAARIVGDVVEVTGL